MNLRLWIAGLLFGGLVAAGQAAPLFQLEKGPAVFDIIPLPQPNFVSGLKAVYSTASEAVSVYWSKSPFLATGPLSALSADFELGRLPHLDPPVYSLPAPGGGTFVVFFSSSKITWREFFPAFLAGWRYFQNLPAYRGRVVFPAYLPFP